jgi:hypothetical protein
VKIPLALLISSIALLSGACALGDDADSFSLDAPKPQTKAVRRSIEAMSAYDDGSGKALAMSADYLEGNNKFDLAISLAKQAVERDPDNMDLHVTYAESMESKLEAQKTKDMKLYQQCVKEWVTILRNEVGEEKGVTFHGVSVFGKLSEDDGRGRLARHYLFLLVGVLPKTLETDEAYIRKAMKHAAVRVDVMAGESSSYAMSK